MKLTRKVLVDLIVRLVAKSDRRAKYDAVRTLGIQCNGCGGEGGRSVPGGHHYADREWEQCDRCGGDRVDAEKVNRVV